MNTKQTISEDVELKRLRIRQDVVNEIAFIFNNHNFEGLSPGWRFEIIRESLVHALIQTHLVCGESACELFKETKKYLSKWFRERYKEGCPAIEEYQKYAKLRVEYLNPLKRESIANQTKIKNYE